MSDQPIRYGRTSHDAVPIGRATAHALRPIDAALARQARTRTFAPVRRSSFDIDDSRAKVFQPIADGTLSSALRWCDKLVQTAQEFDDTGKKHGRRLGPIGDSGIRILHTLLTRCLDYSTGRCEPAIETIMRYTRYARATVVAAMRRLKSHGFLSWVRRTRYTNNKPGEGPIVKQVSNAYFFDLSKMTRKVQMRFRQLLGGRQAAQERLREAQRKAELAERVKTAPLSQIGSTLTAGDNSQLANALDRLGAALEQREEEEKPFNMDSASSVSELNPSSILKKR